MPERRALWQLSAVVVLGHAAVLSQVSTAPAAAPPRGQAGLPVQLLYVRTVQPAAPEKPAATPEPPVTVAALQAEAEPAAVTLPAPQPAPEVQQAAAMSPLDAPAGPGAEPLAVAVAPPPMPAASAPEEVPYLPRGELTQAPKLLAPVQVPFPDEVEGWVDLKVQVTLFIDELGTVRRIRIDSPDVQPSFERAVRAAFSPARFSPGELQQTPVRSQVRLEVAFTAPSRGKR